jgi:hypothetical protein
MTTSIENRINIKSFEEGMQSYEKNSMTTHIPDNRPFIIRIKTDAYTKMTALLNAKLNRTVKTPFDKTYSIVMIKTAQALEKLGYIYPYEEVNQGLHSLEQSFRKLEFKSDDKWEVFDNPYLDNIISNNDVVNFSFGYTYVGRQYYNKFKYFDSKLKYLDHYNYETLEFAFQLNLSRTETIPFSPEAIHWANSQNIKLVAEQLPIANIIDLENNLFEYRKMLYRNSRDNNRVRIILH